MQKIHLTLKTKSSEAVKKARVFAQVSWSPPTLMPADPTCEKEDSQMNSFQEVLQGVKQLKHKYPRYEMAVSGDVKDDDSPDIKDIVYFLVRMRASTFCLSHSAKPEEVRGVCLGGGEPVES